MSLLNQKSRGGLPGKITQEYINNKFFSICPLCGSHEPSWTVRYRVDLLDGRIQFRCNACDSALSITQADLIGVYKLRESRNLVSHLYTWQITVGESIKKSLQGKKMSTVYIKIDELGFFGVETPYSKGQEIPLEELQQIAHGFL